MNKFFFLFLPFLLKAAFITLPFDFSLKKDETAKMQIYYDGKKYDLSLRWTLYKNEVLIVLYKYDEFPYQITLFNTYPIDTFRVKIADYPDFKPYLYVKVTQFSDKITSFRIFLDKVYSKKIKIDFKGK